MAVGGEKLSFTGDVKKDMISKKGVVEIKDLAGGENGPDVGKKNKSNLLCCYAIR